MKRLSSLAYVAILGFLAAYAINDVKQHSSNQSVLVAKQLRSFTVGIESHGDLGTGSLVLANDQNDENGEGLFVITCAHVVEAAFKMEDKKVKVYQHFSHEESVDSFAVIVCYCWDEDIAILRVDDAHILRDYETLNFYLDIDEPLVGEEIFHVGNYVAGNGLYNKSLSTGIISFPNRKQGNICLDQLSCNVLPGSSGGAVVLRKDGRYVGMVSQGLPGGLTLMVPVRRILGFAERNGITFAK